MDETSYFMITILIVIIGSIMFVKSRVATIEDKDVIHLTLDKFPSMDSWYKDHCNEKLSLLTEEEIAMDYIHTIHKIDTKKEYIVVGCRLKEKYQKICEKNVDLAEQSQIDDVKFFDLRSEIGFVGEFAIVPNKAIRKLLEKIKINNTDIILYKDNIKNNELRWIRRVGSKYYPLLYKYTTMLLKERWEKINVIFDNMLIKDATFHYSSVFRLVDKKKVRFRDYEMTCTETCEQMKLVGDNLGNFCYLNMLCSNLEFDAFIKRLKCFVKNMGVYYPMNE